MEQVMGEGVDWQVTGRLLILWARAFGGAATETDQFPSDTWGLDWEAGLLWSKCSGRTYRTRWPYAQMVGGQGLR